MKKFIIGIVSLLTIASLSACKDQSLEKDTTQQLNERNNQLSEKDSQLITQVYGDVDKVQLSSEEQTETPSNLLVDIDRDGKNELLKLTYEYMENHLHVYALEDGNAKGLPCDDYVAYITSIYDTQDGIYVAAIDGDGLCYTNASLLKLAIDGGKIVAKEIINVTCDQDIEEQKREEIEKRLLANEITEEESFEESVMAHTLAYTVDGQRVTKEEFNNKIEEMNQIQVNRKIAYLSDLFDHLWNE